MSADPIRAVAQALDVAVFQRDLRGRLRLAGAAPKWLRALWPPTARRGGMLRPGASTFLDNFLLDAATCWKTRGAGRVRSGLWVEQDARGSEHRLEAIAFTAAGRATLAIVASDALFEERRALVQKARELALAYEKLQRTEKILRESEQRFRALVTATSEVVYQMSPDWREMRQLQGRGFIADTELPCRNWLQKYIHPDDQAHVTAAIRKAVRTRRIFELEHRVLRVDGRLGWTFSRAIPIRDGHGGIVEWFGAASDVTARKEAERALQESAAELERRVQARTAELMQTNAALIEEIARRQRFAERLQGEHDLNKAILAAQSSEAIAEATLRRLHRLLPCDYASLIELDAAHHCANVLASARDGRITSDRCWSLSREQLQKCRALKSGNLSRVRNQRNLFANPQSRDQASVRIWPLIVDVPLVAGETLVGILTLAIHSHKQFTAEHEQIAREVATQLAVALREVRLFEEVKTGRERLRALSCRLVDVQEAERRFLAHELHDEIGQVLTGLKLTLEMSGRMNGESPDATLAEAIGMVDDLMQRVRQLSLDLRPQLLDDLGLMPALDWLFKRYFKQAGLRVFFKHRDMAGRLAGQLETAVFRIVQEALTNVVRHAGVSEVTVRLWRDSRKQTLGVQVHDTGVGFDVRRILSTHSSSGLAGMRERTTLLGGHFTLDSSPGGGTRLTVELPCLPTALKLPAIRRNRK